jgi:hypothetical protein
MLRALFAIVATAALLGGATISYAASTDEVEPIAEVVVLPAECQMDTETVDVEEGEMNNGQRMRACVHALHEADEHGFGHIVSEFAHDLHEGRHDGEAEDASTTAVTPTATATTATATTATATTATATTATATAASATTASAADDDDGDNHAKDHGNGRGHGKSR